jgi:glycosyltransferase involved in cell wall biosynthesis
VIDRNPAAAARTRNKADPLWRRWPYRLIGLRRGQRRATNQDTASLEMAVASLHAEIAALRGEVAALRRPTESTLLTTARALAGSGDHRIVLPTEPSREPRLALRDMRIGLFGNTANNAFILARILRGQGFRADVVLSDFFDHFILNRPTWEVLEFETSWEGLADYRPTTWTPPDFVHSCEYDQQFGQEVANSDNGEEQMTRLYRDAFGVMPAADLARLLAANAAHWPYIRSFRNYDVLVFLGGPTIVAAFSPTPYVIHANGSDLTITAFEETLNGLLARAAYRRCHAIWISAPYFRQWYDRIGVSDRCVLSDFFIDTDLYGPGAEEELRRSWRQRIGGELFLLSVCRQSWMFKGNDRLIRAFARLVERYPELRLVLTEWGTDVRLTSDLAAACGVADRILWLPIASKPVVARRQRAADIVVDQLVMASIGTSIMESMAAGKPVIARHEDPDMPAFDYDPPPLVAASSDAEVANAIERLVDPELRRQAGSAARAWMLRWCSHKTKAPVFVQQLARVTGVARTD